MSNSSVKRSIENTLSYASFFNFPLTQVELHRWLISSVPVSENEILNQHHQHLSSLEKKIRSRLTSNTKEKVTLANKFAKILHFFPSIKLVAITGSVAVNNTKKNDDIDLMIVTSSNTLWLTRPFVLLLAGLFFRRRIPGQDPATVGDTFCINLWLDENELAVKNNKRDLYTAHEVLQIKPILVRNDFYKKFIEKNNWVQKYLANAYLEIMANSPNVIVGDKDNIGFLSVLFYPVNFCLFLLQLLYMKRKITSEVVSLRSAYFHTINFSKKMSEHMKGHKVI